MTVDMLSILNRISNKIATQLDSKSIEKISLDYLTEGMIKFNYNNNSIIIREGDDSVIKEQLEKSIIENLDNIIVTANNHLNDTKSLFETYHDLIKWTNENISNIYTDDKYKLKHSIEVINTFDSRNVRYEKIELCIGKDSYCIYKNERRIELTNKIYSALSKFKNSKNIK